MPFYYHPRTFTPLRVEADRKAIKNGLRHAVFTKNREKYIGEWKNNLREGKGFSLTKKGILYDGDWVNGLRHGFGVLSRRLFTGAYSLVYRGGWAYGKPEGIGWRYYNNGDRYLGFWRRGQRHGYGKMWYADGTFYAGYWKADRRNGLGIFVQDNNNRYEGHWVDDLKDGYGQFYHIHTGQMQEGCWRSGVCVTSNMADIAVRQSCVLPTPYPIPRVKVLNSERFMEESLYWLSREKGEIDKNLKHCINQM
ncbi:MORN repeat-containing protein 3-like isoform X2 [Aricia agestis]|uniref:MORN repeat-containing protein 3-like isoform X2 n=1 Tax=Aricia agestis TaxID=91739 RepID=UPI001C203711|nr:MORN repeat-containing protein 3-like isoform X2 [Aricia agestis]